MNFENITTKACKSINLKSYDTEYQIWRELNLYMDFKYLRKALKHNFQDVSINRNRIDEKVSDIQFCLRQAKDYMQSAKYASIITKPVLIYYAFVSFATALIIFKNKDKTLNSMPESHGLSMIYPDRINDNTKNQFLKIGAKINTRGLFSELSKMFLIDTFSMKIGSNDTLSASKSYKQCFKFNAVNETISTIELNWLFSNLTEIWKECNLLLKIENNIFSGQPILYDNKLLFKISRQDEIVSKEKIQEKLSIISNFTLYDTTIDNFFYKSNNLIEDTIFPLIKTDKNGETFIVADTNNNVISNDLILQFLTFFILGSIARYKPEKWRIILEDNMQGFGLIPNILCEASFTHLPLIILKEFTNKHIIIKK